MLPRGVTTALTVLIGLVWAGNVVVGFVNPSLRDPMINAIFAIVVGAIYALGSNRDSRLGEARRKLADAIAGEDKESRDDDTDAGRPDTREAP